KPIVAIKEDYLKIGVRAELIPVIQHLGITTISQLKEANPNKLFNDICGARKKLKLNEVKNPTVEEVQAWIG
ncbi:MAG: DUF4332 domain-containing protein, partial [Cyclobacteriaceae bacterium]|nr:DUF4332 domain-containing protein [Cyclobacteriaceae bacterium]